MEPPRIVSEDAVDGIVVVALHGEHDVASAPRVRTAIEQALDGGSAVVVDLSQASFLDSTMLGVLLATRDRVGKQGGAFAAALEETGHDEVRRIVEVTGLGPVLPVLDSRAAALAHVKG